MSETLNHSSLEQSSCCNYSSIKVSNLPLPFFSCSALSSPSWSEHTCWEDLAWPPLPPCSTTALSLVPVPAVYSGTHRILLFHTALAQPDFPQCSLWSHGSDTQAPLYQFVWWCPRVPSGAQCTSESRVCVPGGDTRSQRLHCVQG